MRVVFVALGQEQLGISILSAALKEAGHETFLVFEPALFHDRYYFDFPTLGRLLARDRWVVEEIIGLKPDLLAFSVLTPMYTWFLDIAQAVKSRIHVPVVVGGVHPSAVPELCLEEEVFDYVCVGEGEHALVTLCDALASGAGPPSKPIGNMWWTGDDGQIVRGPADPFIQDLTSLPLPDKALWEDVVRIEDNYLIMAARGCPYRCTFCFNNYFAKIPGTSGGKYVRQRPVEHVMDELLAMKADHDFKHVEFVDDIFTLNKRWLQEFLDRFKREIDVPFSCLVHPRFLDHDMAAWLKTAGCDRVQMGIQSADEEYKRSQLLRMEKNDHLYQALDALSAAGLNMKLDHMLGLPGEPLEAQEKAAELFRKYPPGRINTYWLSYLPGTEIFQNAINEGWVDAEEADKINRGRGRVFHYQNEAQDESNQMFYRRYDLLFRMQPLLPRWARERVRASHLPKVPGAVAKGLGFVFDITAALIQRDAETFIYGRHYLHHLRRAALERMTGRPMPSQTSRNGVEGFAARAD